MRHPRKLQSDSGQQRLKDGHADNSLGHRAYRQPGQRDEILASLGDQPRLNSPYCRNKPRTVVEQKAGQHDRRDEFECSEARTAGKGKYRTGQRLQVRSELAQRSPEICRGMVPEGVKLRADDRPVLDAFRRRRDGQGASTKLARKVLQAIDHADAKPCQPVR